MKIILSIRKLLLCLLLIEIANSNVLGPVPTKALINSTTTLRCRIQVQNIHENIKVQWLKDGFGYENETLRDYFNGRYRMPGTKGSGIYDLVIQKIESLDDGEYACQVNGAFQDEQNSNSLETTESINLTVIFPPKNIIVTPLSLGIENNRTIKYRNTEINVIWGKIQGFIEVNCETSKSKPYSVLEWSIGKYIIKEGKFEHIENSEDGSITSHTETLKEADQFFFKTQSTLKLRLRMDHDGKLITCSIKNREDFLYETPEATNIMINVLYVTDVKINFSPQRLISQFTEHETVIINCSALTNAASVNYNWIKYDPQSNSLSMMKASEETGLLKLKISRELNKIFIRCLVLASTKNNVCKPNIVPGFEISEMSVLENCSSAHLAVGSKQILMKVRYSPAIFDSVIETKSAFLGDVVTLTCNVDSNPPSEISWYKSSLTLKEIMTKPNIQKHEFYKDFSVKPKSMLSLISLSTKLQFSVTSAEKLGLFICIARSEGFSPAQKAIFVGQGEKPQIINKHKLIVAKIGSSVRLPCHIFSIPLPKKDDILWLKNSRLKALKLKDQVYQEDRLAGVVSYLYIHQVSNSDYGQYNCSANNMYGQSSDFIELIAPAETSMIYIIGGSCGILLAILFIFIIYYIIRISKAHSSANNNGINYSKGHILSLSNSPMEGENRGMGFANSYIEYPKTLHNEDFIQNREEHVLNPSFLNAPQATLNNAYGNYFGLNDEKHQPNYTNYDQFDLSIPTNTNYQATSAIHEGRTNWIDCENIPHEVTNESTRSYDSGVCPDESNLTSFGSHPLMSSPNQGLSQFQILVYYPQSEGIMELTQYPSEFSNKACDMSNNILSSPNDAIIIRNYKDDYDYRTTQNSLSTPSNSSSTHHYMLPCITSYSPKNISLERFNWTTANQSTKL